MQFTAKALKVLVCAALGLALCGPALAWNDRGHMTVAYIAYKQLTPTTRDRANALLKLNPKYSDWSATVDKQGARIPCRCGKNTTRTLERAADA
jgi:hypothetical protein